MNENHLVGQIYAEIVASDTLLVQDVGNSLTPNSPVNWNNDVSSNPDYRSNTVNDQALAKWYGGTLKNIFTDAINQFSLSGDYEFMPDGDIQKKVDAYRKYMQ